MKLKLLAFIMTATVLTGPAFGGIVSAPWAPDTGNSSEENLYQILGFRNNSDLNSAIANQSGGVATTFVMPLGDVNASFIVDYAGNSGNNSFGIYGVTANNAGPANGNIAPPDTGALLPLISGVGSPSSVLVTYNSTLHTLSANGNSVSVLNDNYVGFYLNTGSLNSDYNTFYSSIINSDDFEHAVLFGPGANAAPNYPNSYVMGWEDETLATGSDLDYQDMVVSVTPVPEPTTLIAGAMLLLPFGASTLRFVRKSRVA